MTYSQAIEVQQSIRRLLNSPSGAAYVRGCLTDAVERNAGTEEIREGDALMVTMRAGVEHGEPYYWAPDICRLVTNAAATLPSYALRPEVLPSEIGYFHFAVPLPLPPRAVGPSDLAGIGWYWNAQQIQMTFFTNDCLPTSPGVPLPVTSGAWRTGTTWHECLGWTGDLGVEIAYPNRHELMVRYMAACLAFIEQPYFGVTPHRAERATRKRLEREGWTDEPTIQVVQLRRSAPQGATGDHDPRHVAWSCQWPVRPHWRMQAVGQDRAERRPVLVRGYIKGDPTKPLKTANDRLFVVTR
jgi:hypothetical protein